MALNPLWSYRYLLSVSTSVSLQHLNMLLKESVDRKNWCLNMVSLHGKERRLTWLKIKGKARRRGHTLLGTPKGTSHWWVCYSGIKWWPGLQPCDCGQAGSETKIRVLAIKKNLYPATYYIVCTCWAGSSKTINNSWMQLHMILKFGSFAALLDPLKNFQNLFVQMSDTILVFNAIFDVRWTNIIR